MTAERKIPEEQKLNVLKLKTLSSESVRQFVCFFGTLPPTERLRTSCRWTEPKRSRRGQPVLTLGVSSGV